MRADAPVFPPLFRGEACASDPFEQAVTRATAGTEPGLIVYAEDGMALRAALVLAPDVVLGEALQIVPVAALGWADALGSHAPPECPLHVEWPAGFRLNGGRCGQVRALAPDQAPGVPDWLVVGIDIPVIAPDRGESEPGQNPDMTTLHAEGCADIAPQTLLESWSRHTLNWMNRWQDEGLKPVHADLLPRLWNRDGQAETTVPGTDHTGHVLGMDDQCGLLLKIEAGTVVIPLDTMLERVTP